MQIEVRKRKTGVKEIMTKYNLIIILVILCVVSACLSPVFLSVKNIFNLLRQQSPYILITIGMLYVVLTGNIDLSQGNIIALSGVATVYAINEWGWGYTSALGILPAVLLGVVVGGVSGLLNGFLTSKLKMMSFVATLAVGMICSGLAYLITNGHPIRIDSDSVSGTLLSNFGAKGIPGINFPWPVVVVIIVVIVMFIIQKYTFYGRLVIASGSNPIALHLAGQDVDLIKMMTFVISGILAALAGIIIAGRTAVAAPNAGSGYEMDSVAGCVIGGASLAGGKGTVLRSVAGVLALGLIGNILDLLSVPAYPQKIIKGVIIIAAVLLQQSMDEKDKN